ncbi:uncharacterized protein BT62DRAFT_931828 [Guyanagaster necrorhizus]|uniref:BZIP domain-containing protein n=1 Tax=Guyanagaster necrorhizus TaxID=856835 RepID=A0A9P7VTG0_9AGAR|nr:uncharacterized protein BT62DRAFT_931828 [Guyanagaster necrorhizus MCA 3950]KAG7446380.1 hypothetical protein BT62DRAFT_931828 [Guyanagaster necrorhizus MCA 3950]
MMNFSNLSSNIANTVQGTGQQPGQSTNGQALSQTMRLRDDPPAITPPSRNPRKRKSPSSTTPDSSQPQPVTQPQPQPQPQQLQHVLPPPHTIMHQLPPGAMPPYQYADYSPGGMPPPPPNSQPDPSGPTSSGQRPLSSSKRAEQNRKAQRAFRERRDQYVELMHLLNHLLTWIQACQGP